MANTKKEGFSCRCGGRKLPGKVPYQELLLDGLVCDTCGKVAFTSEQFRIALEQKLEYERKLRKQELLIH